MNPVRLRAAALISDWTNNICNVTHPALNVKLPSRRLPDNFLCLVVWVGRIKLDQADRRASLSQACKGIKSVREEGSCRCSVELRCDVGQMLSILLIP